MCILVQYVLECALSQLLQSILENAHLLHVMWYCEILGILEYPEFPVFLEFQICLEHQKFLLYLIYQVFLVYQNTRHSWYSWLLLPVVFGILVCIEAELENKECLVIQYTRNTWYSKYTRNSWYSWYTCNSKNTENFKYSKNTRNSMVQHCIPQIYILKNIQHDFAYKMSM